ncbi:hypothetical protein phiBZS1_p71 [Serratia phage vB_SspM_BZS1]|nr:hypothetical protein phiBZS1_p71 [Serratia phage vB_SspM_BZS1]
MKLTRFDVKVLKTPHKGCPTCQKANPAAVHKCVYCGHVFNAKKRIK